MTRDHTFHRLVVARVVPETADASSFVLAVPDELRETFAYEPGQFCTFRVVAGDEPHIRCYSMSSAPALGEQLQVTVKRVPGGAASNWMIDHLSSGDVVDVAPPAGFFQLAGSGPVLLYAAGSGITPIFSLLKTALSCTTRAVHLLYANRDRDSVIFDTELDKLARENPERFAVVHHLDVDDGFVGPEAVRSIAAAFATSAEVYVCGPTPFMDIVETTLVDLAVDAKRIHIERFTPGAPVAYQEPAAASASEPDGLAANGVSASISIVTIELDGRTEVTEHRAGTTILQTARQLGMSPPFSCESGSCATCMGRLLEGEVSMHVNNALTPEEVDEGWILTCQSVPTTPTVHVVYGYD